MKYIIFFLILLIPIPSAFAVVTFDGNVEIQHGNTNMTFNDPITVNSLSLNPGGIGISASGESERNYNFTRTGGGLLDIELTQISGSKITFEPQNSVTDVAGNITGSQLGGIEFDNIVQSWTFADEFNTFLSNAATTIELCFTSLCTPTSSGGTSSPAIKLEIIEDSTPALNPTLSFSPSEQILHEFTSRTDLLYGIFVIVVITFAVYGIILNRKSTKIPKRKTKKIPKVA